MDHASGCALTLSLGAGESRFRDVGFPLDVGPRATRRLGWVLGTGIAVAAAIAAPHFFGSDSSTGSRDSAESTPPRQDFGARNGGVAYGDAPKQVLAKVGSPTKKRGACWIYSANRSNGHYIIGKFVDRLRYCFGDGPAGGKAVTAIDVHIIPHTLPTKKWYPGGWNHAMARSYSQQPPG